MDAVSGWIGVHADGQASGVEQTMIATGLSLGIVKGVQKLFGMKRRPKPRTMQRLAEPWRPYRSVAAWYLWRI